MAEKDFLIKDDVQLILHPSAFDQIKPLNRELVSDHFLAQQPLPKVQKSIIYVVGGVIFDAGRVLMIQEAKESCRGRWSLPMGRVEPNETLVQSVKREVLEESGLQFEVDQLLSFHVTKFRWQRFIFLGRVVGGKLKSTADADEESLQAAYLDISMVVAGGSDDYPLRSHNLCMLVSHANDVATRRAALQTCSTLSYELRLLPSQLQHHHVSLRLCLWHFFDVPEIGRLDINKPDTVELPMKDRIRDVSKSVCMLTNKDGTRLPLERVCFSSDDFSIFVRHECNRMLRFTADSLRILGLLAVEHDGRLGQDGLCLTVCVSLSDTVEPPDLHHSDLWQWTRLCDVSDGDRLLHFVLSGGMAAFI